MKAEQHLPWPEVATHAHSPSAGSSLLVDRLGVWLGFTCAVHCLAMPLLVGVLPLLGLGFLSHGFSEAVILGAILVTALAASLWGYRRHRELRVVMAFVGAVAVLFLGKTLGEHHAWGQPLAISGGLAIACAHLISARLCRRCGEKHRHEATDHRCH